MTKLQLFESQVIQPISSSSLRGCNLTFWVLLDGFILRKEMKDFLL